MRMMDELIKRQNEFPDTENNFKLKFSKINLYKYKSKLVIPKTVTWH